MKKRIISLFLAVVMIVGMLPMTAIPAFAENVPDSTGKYIARSWDSTKKQVVSTEEDIPETAQKITADTRELESGWYVLLESVTLPEGAHITVNGDVNLVLCDGCELKISSSGDRHAAIELTDGGTFGTSHSLTVYGQKSGTGSIVATGGSRAAGIGSWDENDCGTIIINGGIVTATGGSEAAGIGGGFKRDCGDIKIYGGTVTATGGYQGAGIGNGYDGNGGSITVYGGTVKAYGNNSRALGGGSSGIFKNKISIYGGDILADSKSSNDAVIADSVKVYADSHNVFTVKDANGTELSFSPVSKEDDIYKFLKYNRVLHIESQPVHTFDDYVDNGDGTHSLKCSVCGEISTPEAHTYTNGVCVCGVHECVEYRYYDTESGEFKTGYCNEYEVIDENNKPTTWENGKWYVVKDEVVIDERIVVEAEIGTEEKLILTDGCKLTVPNGISVGVTASLTIYAQSGGTGELHAGHNDDNFKHAGIGSDEDHNGGTVDIHGGVVTASSYNGAGIGGGYKGDSGTVDIYSGTVTASSYGGAGIGGGYTADGSKANIYGGTVTASSHSGAGIGGGESGTSGARVTVNGGTVTATSIDGAGIGGGESGDGGYVAVNGGTVTATSIYGAGIGGGDNSVAHGILIVADGLTIKAGDDAYSALVVSFENYRTNRNHYISITPAHTHDFTGDYVDNGDSTHSRKCTGCDEVSTPEAHTFVNGKCVCGVSLDRCVEFRYYDTESGEFKTGYCSKYIVIDEDHRPTGLDNDLWYVVKGEVEIGAAAGGIRITLDGDVKLILTDGCKLTVPYGISVSKIKNDENTLTIYAQSGGTGELFAGRNDLISYNAGIGGDENLDGGTVNIHGGVVTARSYYGAGIGGAGSNEGNGGSGSANIYGGTVNASSIYGAGIGGGYSNSENDFGGSGSANIYGGTVNASSIYGAGIGGAGSTDYPIESGSGTVNIYGGTVNASSGMIVGIGGITGCFIKITGGVVTAKSEDVSGIGNTPHQENYIDIGDNMSVYDSDNNLITLPEGYSWWQQLVGMKYVKLVEAGAHNWGKYIDRRWDEDKKQVVSTEEDIPEDAVKITADTTEWEDGWYVVDEDVTIDEDVTVSGNVSLILTDGKALTVTGYITGMINKIEIYAQSEGENMGALNTKEMLFPSAGDDENKHSSVLIDGGRINISGGNIGISSYNLEINGGDINISDEATGIYFVGQLIINGGNVTATGGIGIRGALDSSSMTINGGNVIAKNSSGQSAILCTNITFDEVNMRCFDEANNPVLNRAWNGSYYKIIPVEDTPDIAYLYYDEESKKMETGFHSGKDLEFIYGESLPTTWQNNKWYYVNESPRIDSDIAVEGEVHLILHDDNTLTVNGTISGEGQLYIHSQSIGNTAGKLVCTSADIEDGKYGERGNDAIAISERISVDGAAVIVKAFDGTDAETEPNYASRRGGDGGSGVYSENITVNYGSITATGGNGGDSGMGQNKNPVFAGGDGGKAVQSGFVTVNYGSITATGGNGGKGGAEMADDNGFNGGCGGKALIINTLTVNGGSVTANGGNGGDGGRGVLAGTGGDSGKAAEISTLTVNGGSVTANGGKGGNGGDGAEFRYDADGWHFVEYSAVNGGDGGNSSTALNATWINVSDGIVMANGGDGGNGGNGGTNGKNGDKGANGTSVFAYEPTKEIIGTIMVKENEADNFIPLQSGESISDYRFAKIIPASTHTHDFTGDYVDNGDGTHSQECTGCDELSTPEAHTFVNGVCVCGVVEYRYYDTESGEFKTGYCGEYEVIDKDLKLTSWGINTWYVVKGEVEIDERVTVNTDGHAGAKLILTDGCKLTVPEGISVNKSNGHGDSLTIYAQSGGTGELNAGHNNALDFAYAGIGGDKERDGGTVNIHGGVVSASSVNAAGIGGGGSGGCSGGPVNIYGGTVTASSIAGAGIGGGSGLIGGSGSANIYGGNVTAISEYGDGIGGGKNCTDHGNFTVADGLLIMAGDYADNAEQVTAANYRTNRNRYVSITPHTHDFTGNYVDNGDGTHSQECTGCDELSTPEAHTFVNGVCVCGAKEAAALTLRDIIGKVEGTYYGEIPEEQETATASISSKELVTEWIRPAFAAKMIINAAGAKVWQTDTVVDGKPVYSDEVFTEIPATINTILDSEIEITKEADDTWGIPAGIYLVKNDVVPLAFWDELIGHTQKMYIIPRTYPIILNRIGGAGHEHTFSTEYSSNEAVHWLAATCEHTELSKNLGEHTFGTDGKCTVCGYKKIAEDEHTHTYGTATYIWGEGYSTCTAYHTCTDADCGHTELETVNTVTGDTEITATFTKTGFETQTKQIVDPEPQHIHTPTLVSGQAPTCTADGWKDYYQCSDNTCNKLFSDPACKTEITLETWKTGSGKIAATGHKAVNIPEKAATTSADGYKTYWYCPVCNKYFKEAACTNEITDLAAWKSGDGKIEKLSGKHTHTPTLVAGKAATCTADGWKDYYKCSDTECGKFFSDPACKTEITLETWKSGDGKIAKLGHNTIMIPQQDPTTEEYGVKAYWYCGNCKQFYADNSGNLGDLIGTATDLYTWKSGAGKIEKLTPEAPAHEHAPTLVSGQAATCTTDGWKDYYKCGDNECGKLFSDPACKNEITLETWKTGSGKIAKLGHNTIMIPQQDPTTEEYGVKAYWYCGNCNKFYADNSGNLGDLIGTATDLYTWKTGEGKIEKITPEAPAHEHTPVLVSGQAATCTADGWKDYYKCGDTECTKLFSDPACTSEITNLNTWKAGSGKIAATGHKAVNIPEKAATTSADGYKTYWYCPVCETYYKDATCTEKIDNIETWKTTAQNQGGGKIEQLTPEAPHSHTYGEATYIWNEDLSQCTAIKSCECGHAVIETVDTTTSGNTITADFSDAFTDQTKTVEAAEHTHTPTLVAGKAPTCTADGWKDYYQCSDNECGKFFSDPACKNEITNLETWKTDSGKIAATGHKAVNIPEKAATTSADGYKTYWYCPVCNKYFKEAACTNEIDNLTEWKSGEGKIEKITPETPAHEHAPTLVSGQAATCTTDGWKDYYKCSDGTCNKLFSDPACTTEITLETWKSGDGKIAKLGHNTIQIPQQDATTEEYGVKAYWYCGNCKQFYADNSGNLGDLIGDATALYAWKTGAGRIEKLTPEAPAHVHTPTLVSGQVPTCTTDGWKDYYKCSDGTCNKLFSDPACKTEITNLDTWKTGSGKIAKLGHNTVMIPQQDPTTEEYGVKAYWYCGNCNKFYADNSGNLGDLIGDATALYQWKSGDGKIEKITPETPHEHTYGTASYFWNEDLSKCTAIKTCECGHAVIETVNTTKSGNTITANFSAAFIDQTKPVVTPEAPHEHTYGDATYIWNEDLSECTAIKSCECGHAVIETVTTSIVGNNHVADFSDAFTDQTKTVEAPHTHTYGEATYIWNEDLTKCTAYHTCTGEDCGNIELETVNTEKEGNKITATFINTAFAKQTKTVTTPEAPHEHTFSETYSKNETVHWFAATCEHSDIAKGMAAHTFGEGVVDGNKTTYTCTVCGYEKVETKEDPVHEHTFSDEWSYNELVHWHKATCEHTNLVSGFSTHTFTEETNGNATTYTCDCGYTKTVNNKADDDEGAMISTTFYESLSDAVSEVKNGETIKLLKDTDEMIVVSRKVSFKINSNGFKNSAIIVGGKGYTVKHVGNTYTVMKVVVNEKERAKDIIILSGHGAEREETNPETGAPIMNFGAIAVILGAAFVLPKKH